MCAGRLHDVSLLPLLRAMFLSEMSEAKQELIEIKDFDGDAIQDLVHFAYSSKLTLTVDNVQPLLYAACILQVNQHKGLENRQSVARVRHLCDAAPFLAGSVVRWSWWPEPAAST